MAVRVLLVDGTSSGESIEARLGGASRVTRARTLEGAVELLQWFEHRVVVVLPSSLEGASPPAAWPLQPMPPIVTLGGDEAARRRWASVAEFQVEDFDELDRVVNELVADAERGSSSGPSCRPCVSPTVRSIIESAHDGCVVMSSDDVILCATPKARELLSDFGPLNEGQPAPGPLRGSDLATIATQQQKTVELRVASNLGPGCRAIWVRDVTDRARSGDLERQLRHSDRLASMGQLAAGVAHEVNNPAAFVTANLCMMSEYVGQLFGALGELERRSEADPRLASQLGAVEEAHRCGETLRELDEIIRENLEGMGRISTILRDLRNFSRIEDDQVELVHPNEIVNAACSLVHNQIRHRAQLVKELGEVRSIPADRNKLVQVLTNLLMNAAQATPDGDNAARFIRVSTWERDGRVLISVTDNGCGVPEEIRGRIFEPFFTTKGRDRGTGLGLALCADIVRQHGGDIEVKSEVGRGARFIVRLPLESPLEVAAVPPIDPSEAITQLPSQAETTSLPGTVLLVDDEPMVLRAFERSLKKRHSVRTVTSGEEALELLRAGAVFDVIVCDLMMPGMDGIKLYEELRAVAPALRDRFIFCSGGAFTPRAREFCASVRVPVLDKPLSTAKLEEAIQESLGRRADEGETTSDLGVIGRDLRP